MHKKTRPAVSNSRVCSDRGKRIGPVFSSVEKAQAFLNRNAPQKTPPTEADEVDLPYFYAVTDDD